MEQEIGDAAYILGSPSLFLQDPEEKSRYKKAPLECPGGDSFDTKTCCRSLTNGGTLRNVQLGGNSCKRNRPAEMTTNTTSPHIETIFSQPAPTIHSIAPSSGFGSSCYAFEQVNGYDGSRDQQFMGSESLSHAVSFVGEFGSSFAKHCLPQLGAGLNEMMQHELTSGWCGERVLAWFDEGVMERGPSPDFGSLTHYFTYP
ncbi:hypothetical protein AMTRI_Chr02g215420 [Amborella trichopoda]